MTRLDQAVLAAADAWQAARDLYLSDGTVGAEELMRRERAKWHAEAELAVAVVIRRAALRPVAGER